MKRHKREVKKVHELNGSENKMHFRELEAFKPLSKSELQESSGGVLKNSQFSTKALSANTKYKSEP